MSPPPTRAIYLSGAPQPVFALLHAPEPQAARDTAVLICPPFGWEDVCSYRSRRDWALELARAGYRTLRVDLPGCGDSGGDLQGPRVLDGWIAAVRSAAEWLHAEFPVARVASIGIGIGGLVSCASLSEEAPIEELILWATPSRGSACVRELRAFGRMERAKFAEKNDPEIQELAPGSVGAGGFVLPSETVEALKRLDLTERALACGTPRRALLLGREGIGVEERLAEHLRRSGAEVRSASATGYAAMMAEPQEARPPLEIFSLVQAWLDETSARCPAPGPGEGLHELLREPAVRPAMGGLAAGQAPGSTATERVQAGDVAVLRIAGVEVRETPLSIQSSGGRLFGILCEPAAGSGGELGAVLLNAGAIRRIGPNRLWVEIARRWAARGVPTMRLDLEGLGDADGDASRFVDVAELYIPQLVEQVREALDVLSARGVAGRFVLSGLCSGAYWSFHGALSDERVCAAFMINPRTLFFDRSVETFRYLRRGLLQPAAWRMVMRGDVGLSRVRSLAREVPGSLARRALASVQERGEQDELERSLDRLRDAGKHLVFVFSGNEPLHRELERQGRTTSGERWPNVEFKLLPGNDHTLRPARSQRSALAVLDRALENELQRSRR